MTSRFLRRSAFLVFFSLVFAVHPSFADASHARIIRLSLVQGDVRFARETHGDPLSDQNTWEAAELNLPIRQGYVLSTDNGRAAVEFENGTLVFLNESTVLEFYDLSLEDGAKTTRLVLRQGTASFHINPGGGDYFSVTGGDFTVEAPNRASFRVDNFDDGSTVNVLKGHVSVLRKNKTTPLAKDQSLSMQANDDNSIAVGSAREGDDFDRWVSGRVDSLVTATAAGQQYVNSPYYSSGMADLYTYGAWFPCSGFGNCWRPYGANFGWSPFSSGGWFTDPFYGAYFIGNQPWGWLPYHFGGWIFDPGFGWMWTPGGLGFGGGNGFGWRPVTGVWVRSKPGQLGIVPVHPLDARGKTPVNISRGVFPVNGAANTPISAGAGGEGWKVVKAPPRDALSASRLSAAAPPVRVSRSMATGAGSFSRPIKVDAGSSITYDAHERRFVNTNSTAPAVASPKAGNPQAMAPAAAATSNGTSRVGVAPTTQRSVTPPTSARASVAPPAARVVTPPAARSTGGGTRYAPSPSASGGSRASSAPVMRSAPTASSGSSSSGRASSGSTSGGRPH